MLKAIFQELVTTVLCHNGSLVQGNMIGALQHEDQIRVIRNILKNSGYTVIMMMKSTKMTHGVWQGRSCDIYTEIQVETADPAVIQVLTDLHFVPMPGGMRFKI